MSERRPSIFMFRSVYPFSSFSLSSFHVYQRILVSSPVRFRGARVESKSQCCESIGKTR